MPKPFLDKSVLPENIATHSLKIKSELVSLETLSEIENELPVQFLYESDKKRLTITYDESKVSFSQLITSLEEHNSQPLKNWWFRIKAAFYDFEDENVAEQSHAKPKGCCNKLPH
jgi:hypothetical protein